MLSSIRKFLLAFGLMALCGSLSAQSQQSSSKKAPAKVTPSTKTPTTTKKAVAPESKSTIPTAKKGTPSVDVPTETAPSTAAKTPAKSPTPAQRMAAPVKAAPAVKAAPVTKAAPVVIETQTKTYSKPMIDTTKKKPEDPKATAAVEENRVKRTNERYLQKLAAAKKGYKNGELSSREVWQTLSVLFNSLSDGVSVNPSDLLQSQAHLLDEAKYPYLSAKYASWAILTAADPYSFEMEPSWRLLSKIASKRQIHDILIHLAKSLGYQGKLPPVFKREWYYFVAEAMEKNGMDEQARAVYAKLERKDRYYLAASYQLAMNYYLAGEQKKAVPLLFKIIDQKEKVSSKIEESKRRQYVDYANITLGRIAYENENYIDSIRAYRRVSRTSPIFYDALFEQSWSFFLAGYPNHALGSLYSAASPFFPGRFNPEISILRTLQYYWMCRYEDARTSLAEFVENYSTPISDLGKFLDRRNLKPDTAYELFENTISGVSSESLGISRDLLQSVGKSDRMKFARDRLATVVMERDNLIKRGIFGSKRNNEFPKKMLSEWVEELRQELGKVYIVELEALRESFKVLRGQADFLYIELLMSEKEQILGRELHAGAKIDQVSDQQKVRGWGNASVPWKGSTKGEYWWDEIGFYIFSIEPQCREN